MDAKRVWPRSEIVWETERVPREREKERVCRKRRGREKRGKDTVLEIHVKRGMTNY